MKKILLIVAVILVLAVIVTYASLDWVVGSAIETGATSALGQETTVGSTSVGLFSGGLALKDFRVANPPGFSSPDIFAIRKVEMDVSLGTLFDEEVVAPRLLVEGMKISLERKGSEVNYSKIRERLSAHGQKGSGEKGPPKRFVIQEVILRDLTADVTIFPVDVTVQIPEIRMQGIGSDDGGVVQDELARRIFNEVMKEVTLKGGVKIPANLAAHIRGTVSDQELDRILQSLPSGTGKDVIKGVLDQIRKN